MEFLKQLVKVKGGMGGDRARLLSVLPVPIVTALCLAGHQPAMGETTPTSFLTCGEGDSCLPVLAQADTPTLERDRKPTVTPVRSLSPSIVRQGNQLSVNGHTFPVAWSQQPVDATSGIARTGIADVGLIQALGVELLNSGESTRQPIQWFSLSPTAAPSLTAWVTGQYRYLDITDFARQAGWQLSIEGNILRIATESAKVTGIRQGRQEWGDRVVVELDRPTPWQTLWVSPPSPTPKDTPDDPTKPVTPASRTQPRPRPTAQEWLISVDAQLAAALPPQFPGGNQLKSLKVEAVSNQTNLRLRIPLGWRPQVFTLANPNRLVIDIRPDSLVEKDIVWAPGVRWRQQYQTLGGDRFPVVWLEVNPRQPGIQMRPLLSHPPTDQGTAPLLETAEQSQVAAAINAGFFNRIERLPLGAVRRDNRWLSGPILNRGAIAWNDRGEIGMGRLSLQETLITDRGLRLAVTHLNSAYVQAGIGRYTPEWGKTYTPLSDGETIVTVAGDRVLSQSVGGKTAVPIPTDGYVLALRSDPATATQLPVGVGVQVESTAIPADFNRFPYILGGGPVLIQNSQIVLDAKAEGFSDAYVKQTAIRSAIGRNAAGNLLIAAVHNRAGGAGPTFAELAQIMQKLGAVDALNLDGGSSTSLYLGGQLLDRPPQTAARVHNALGIFIRP